MLMNTYSLTKPILLESCTSSLADTLEMIGLPDTDGDGINLYDLCEWTETGLSTNSTGCSWNQQDEDQDGLNVDDFCPNTTWRFSKFRRLFSISEIPMVMATMMPSISAHFLQQIMTMTKWMQR